MWVCCNQRCLNKWIRQLEKSPNLAHRGKAVPWTSARDTPPEAESSWATLSYDVLSILGARLPLRDRLAASLACKHWRGGLTHAATHLRAVVDDASSADARRRGGAAGCAVLAAAHDAMPDVGSLELAVHHRCYNHRNLLQHLRALGTWRRLRHLRVRWKGLAPTYEPSPSLFGEELLALPDFQPGLPPPCDCAGCALLHRAFQRYRTYHEAAQKSAETGSTSIATSVQPATPPPSIPARISVREMGALGQLTSLQSLSLTADFASNPGMYSLSSLVRLTSLELLHATDPYLHPQEYYTSAPYSCGSHVTWDPSDTSMACLDRLQRLRISAQLLSPAAVGVLADLPALTHLHLDQLDLGSYGGYLLQADGSEPWVGASALAEEIKKFKATLRTLTITLVADREHNNSLESHTECLIEVCRGLAAMISDQREQLAAHAPKPTSDSSTGKEQPQRRRRRHGRRRRQGAALTQSTQNHPASTHTQLRANGSQSSRLQAGDPSTKPCGAPTHGSGPAEAATAVYIHSIPCATAAAQAVADAENLQAERDSVEPAGQTANACSGGDGAIPAPQPWLLLTQQLVDAVCAVSTLRRLELGFAEGHAHELYRLQDLTALTHLALSCSGACRISLGVWDMERIVMRCSSLTSLLLHVPAECLPGEVLQPLAFSRSLTALDLACVPHTREVAAARFDIRTRLMTDAAGLVLAHIASLKGLGGAGRNGKRGSQSESLGAGVAAWGHRARRQVEHAANTLMTLQQLVRAMQDDRDVQKSLRADAEWQQRQAEAAAEAEAEAAAAAVAAVEAAEAAAAVVAVELEAMEAAVVAATDMGLQAGVLLVHEAPAAEGGPPVAAEGGAAAAAAAVAGTAHGQPSGDVIVGTGMLAAAAPPDGADAAAGAVEQEEQEEQEGRVGRHAELPAPQGHEGDAPAAASRGGAGGVQVGDVPAPPALPSLPLWVVQLAVGLQQQERDGEQGAERGVQQEQEQEQEQDGSAPHGTAGSAADVAAGGEQAGEAEEQAEEQQQGSEQQAECEAELDKLLQYIPLHELAVDTLHALRQMLVWEVVVVGGAYHMVWAPARLRHLRVEGFSGLRVPRDGVVACGASLESLVVQLSSAEAAVDAAGQLQLQQLRTGDGVSLLPRLERVVLGQARVS